MLHEFHRVKGRVTRIGVEDHPEITIRAPTVKRRVEITSRVLPIPEVPPHIRIELRFHELAQTVCEIEPIDETRGLSPFRSRIGIVLSADEFDIGAVAAKVIADLLAQVGRIHSPVVGGL